MCAASPVTPFNSRPSWRQLVPQKQQRISICPVWSVVGTIVGCVEATAESRNKGLPCPGLPTARERRTPAVTVSGGEVGRGRLLETVFVAFTGLTVFELCLVDLPRSTDSSAWLISSASACEGYGPK